MPRTEQTASCTQAPISLCELIDRFSTELSFSRARAAFVLRDLFSRISYYLGYAKHSAKLDVQTCWAANVNDPGQRNEFYRVSADALVAYFASWVTQDGQEFIEVCTLFDGLAVESDAAIFFAPAQLILLMEKTGAERPDFLMKAAAVSTAVARITPAQADGALANPGAVTAPHLSDDQRSVMAARFAFVREVEQLSQTVSQQCAIYTLTDQAESGDLKPYLAKHIVRANDRWGEDRTLSERTLKRWLAAYRRYGVSGLAPARRPSDMNIPAWANDFLKHYWKPEKPSIKDAYAAFADSYQGDYPSIYQVRSFLRKLRARSQG